MAAFQQACGQILAGNGQKAAEEAGRTLRAYLLNIAIEPRSRDFRTIPKNNAVYMDKVCKICVYMYICM